MPAVARRPASTTTWRSSQSNTNVIPLRKAHIHPRKAAMKVLVTGTTGYIGRAVTHRLQTAGHTVIGLARGELAARTLAAAGIEAVRGDLADAAALRSAAARVEAVIETASAD